MVDTNSLCGLSSQTQFNVLSITECLEVYIMMKPTIFGQLHLLNSIGLIKDNLNLDISREYYIVVDVRERLIGIYRCECLSKWSEMDFDNTCGPQDVELVKDFACLIGYALRFGWGITLLYLFIWLVFKRWVCIRREGFSLQFLLRYILVYLLKSI